MEEVEVTTEGEARDIVQDHGVVLMLDPGAMYQNVFLYEDADGFHMATADGGDIPFEPDDTFTKSGDSVVLKVLGSIEG